jgi:hypothetical protein
MDFPNTIASGLIITMTMTFTDAGELAVNISSTFLGYISINFTVPANAVPGTTRMRVTMRYDSPPSPCGSYPRGETEDYT